MDWTDYNSAYKKDIVENLAKLWVFEGGQLAVSLKFAVDWRLLPCNKNLGFYIEQ